MPYAICRARCRFLGRRKSHSHPDRQSHRRRGFCRLRAKGEPYQTFIYYQVKSLDPSLSSPEIIRQVAWLKSAFTLAQCFSVLLLGKIADSPRGGRKLVLLMGTGGSRELGTRVLMKRDPTATYVYIHRCECCHIS